ncbi:MAG TPA: ATP-binding protein [Anaerolineae bacterium]|nr:ATP-binding protein [Anaerolineae bacterium]
MSTKTNPFWIDGPVTPSRFIGRRREVRKTFSQVTGPGQGSVAISGPRCTGKTSLLYYIAAPETAAEWDLTEDNALIPFLDCQLVDHPFNVTAFWRQILNLLQPHLQDSIGEELQELCQQEQIGNADFEVILDALHEGGQRLILLLDNFEQLIRTQVTNETVIRDFLSQLRALINRGPPRTLSLVVATDKPLEELCQTIDFGGASPFPNSFMSVRLKGFSEQEINELIETALSGTSVTFDEHDRRHVFRLSRGHPLLVQLAGHLLFEAKAAGPVTAESYQAIEARFREEVRRAGLSSYHQQFDQGLRSPSRGSG